MKLVLVTGEPEFIGANFVLDWLTQSDETLINIDVLNYAGNRENLAPRAGDERRLFVQRDIGDSTLVTGLLAGHQLRAILNFATESHVGRSISARWKRYGKPGRFKRSNSGVMR